MNDRQHSVLSLFYDEGHSEITPSFLAYRMRMSTREASELLDEMVTQDTLDLHVDDEGHLIYSLPTSETHRIGQGRPASHGPSSNPGPRQEPAHTGHDGYAPSGPQGSPSQQSHHAQQSHHRHQPVQPQRPQPQDGTDGSVNSPYPPRGQANPSPQQPRPKQQPPQQGGYDPRANPHAAPHRGSSPNRRRPRSSSYAPAHQQNASPRPSPRGMPDNQALTPYQSQHQPPARRNRYEPSDGRVPILAGALSLLVPGLGQFYNGEIGKGVMLLFSCLLLSIFLLFWVVWIWSIIDAYMVAERSNQKRLTDQTPPQRPMLPHHPGRSNSNAA